MTLITIVGRANYPGYPQMVARLQLIDILHLLFDSLRGYSHNSRVLIVAHSCLFTGFLSPPPPFGGWLVTLRHILFVSLAQIGDGDSISKTNKYFVAMRVE